MNEFLEQLVRVLTNAYSRSQKKFGERVSPGSTNQRSCLCLPCCWGTNATKAASLDPSGLENNIKLYNEQNYRFCFYIVTLNNILI